METTIIVLQSIIPRTCR